MAKRISKAERDDFANYLRQCTDQQVRGVFENEKAARRQVYTNLARAEATRRGMTTSEEISASPRPLGFNFRSLIARIDGSLTSKQRKKVALTRDEWAAVKAAILTLSVKLDDRKLVEVAEAVATLLSAPRDRLGRLEPAQAPHSAEARETVRMMAIGYGAPPSKDYMEQCAKVLRAAVAEQERLCKKCGASR